MAIETHYLAVGNHGDTYRLRPNPDAPIEEGFTSGALFDYSDDGVKYTKEIFISPESLKDIAEMFSKAAGNA